MFTLSKLVWLMLEPSNFLAFVILGGVLCGYTVRFRRMGLGMALAGSAFSLVAGFLPIGTMLLRPLEAAFPAYRDDGQPVKGIVVLGGAMNGEVTQVRGRMAMNEAGERVIEVVPLARRYPEATIAFSGGTSVLLGKGVPESDAIERVMAELLPDRQLVYERHSRNTHENATMSYQLLQPKPGEKWLLVTSAWHMPRSMGLFRKAGWTITPYPVDYRTSGDATDFMPNPTVGSGIQRLDAAMKEWIGLLFAYLVGQTETFWPAQDPPRRG